MKVKKYIKPQMEVYTFSAEENIITASNVVFESSVDMLKKQILTGNYGVSEEYLMTDYWK